MHSFCIEVKTACRYCGDPLPLNAFVATFRCEKCNKDNEITEETWKSLLEDSTKEVKNYGEGEGQNSTVFTGEYQFAMTYGRQNPRCGKCKTTIPEEELAKYSSAGDYKCGKCGNAVHIRPADNFARSVVKEAVLIAGEDTGQFLAGNEGLQAPQAAKPVIFTCPSCAGALKVDGTKRIIACSYCSSDIYLPDDLWFALHPAKTIERWYITMDTKKVEEKLMEWYYLSDVASDKNGNIYVASAVDGTDDFSIWSFTPAVKTRWVKKNLKLDYENTRIFVSNSGRLLVYNHNYSSIIVLSAKRGEELKRINLGGKGCHALIQDTDDTILALMNDKVVRLKEDGTYIPAWKTLEENGMPKKGFFQKLFGGDDEEQPPVNNEGEYGPCVKDMGSRPGRVSAEYTNLGLSPDGHVYFLDRSSNEGMLAKYTREGKQLWKKLIPLKYKDCKPAFDKHGRIYIIGLKDDGNTNLIRFSPDGNEVETLLTDLIEGGVLEEEDMLCVSPEGQVYCFKFYNRLKIFHPNFSVKYISEQSMKSDKEAMDREAERREKEG